MISDTRGVSLQGRTRGVHNKGEHAGSPLRTTIKRLNHQQLNDMDKTPFFHALKIDEDTCIGCSHCMKICPTEALRVRDGKAMLIPDRCIDCGNCFKVCPTHSIYVKQDDFEDIFNFPIRVALIPSVFMGLFPNDITVSRIYSILKEIGFTHVIEAESSVPVYTAAKKKFTAENPDIKPLISTFCPAIVRLIQVKFPGLTENLIPLRAPIDITAMYIRRKLKQDTELKDDQIGIFYITPCAAKIAAVKNPVGEEKSLVDGVINMDSLYNRVYHEIKKQGKGYKEQKLPVSQLSADSVLSSLTNGVASPMRDTPMPSTKSITSSSFWKRLKTRKLRMSISSNSAPATKAVRAAFWPATTASSSVSECSTAPEKSPTASARANRPKTTNWRKSATT